MPQPSVLQSDSASHPSGTQVSTMQRYYKWHARIYDWTRWTFLFGRKRVIRKIPLLRQQPVHLLEVGCGTGFNLSFVRRYFFNSQLIGYDVSADMIRIAQQRLRPEDDPRIRLYEAPYQPGSHQHAASQDVVLFSYSLTMINPYWEELLQQAYKDLKPGGFLAVVDFHDSAFPWFKRHMGNNHVRMDGHLLPALKALGLRPCVTEVRPAYAGLWHYMLFIGMKPAT